ncbi:MAG: hypothetical protein M1833_004083 [Piccolia ochrophora]|nr:MAG: hypothetical protein M1833_004083 [Piccolia ochrophora]
MQFQVIALLAIASTTLAGAPHEVSFRQLGKFFPEISMILEFFGNSSDIAAWLNNDPQATVFLATNDAFSQKYYTKLPLDDKALVKASLQYCIIPKVLTSAELSAAAPTFLNTALTDKGYSLTSNGTVIKVAKDGDKLYIETGVGDRENITTTDVAFRGGIVHILDRLPNRLVLLDETAGAINLTSLANIATVGAPETNLSATADITIFAPSNEALARYQHQIGSVVIPESVWANHVVNNSVLYSTKIETGVVRALGGRDISLSKDTEGKIKVNDASVVKEDVLVMNGVVHIIDSVLADPPVATPETS